MRNGSNQSPNSNEVLRVPELYVHPWDEYIRTTYGSSSDSQGLDRQDEEDYNLRQ